MAGIVSSQKNDKTVVAFEQWRKRCTHKYIKAICKPCWEIKYCPYGSIIEDFPISDDEYGCRIFGHICPVFFMAEPFTETKKLRNITRIIPQATRILVDRRDRGVCQICRKNIPVHEINYDHLIPYSKGGSSDISNIRQLCDDCNKKRGNSFENEHLVINARELSYDYLSINEKMLEDLLALVMVYHELISKEKQQVIDNLFLRVIQTDDKETDIFMLGLVTELYKLLISDILSSVKKKTNILKYRWGLVDKSSHSVEETCNKYKISKSYYYDQESILIRHIGFVLKKDIINESKYSLFKVDSTGVKKGIEHKLIELTQIQH